MPLTQSFPSGSILLVRFPAQSCIVLYGNISQAMGLVAGNGLLRHHKTVLRNRYNRSFGIADVVFPYRRRCNDYPMSACRVVPTPCRRDSNRSVRSPNRRRRQPAARCPDDPSGNSAFPFRLTWTRAVPAERGAFQVERSVLRAIYQRTQITQPVAGGLRRREFRLLKCKRLSRPCLQVRKITTKIKVLNV